MASLFLRKLFKKMGILGVLKSIKRKFVYMEYGFMPCTPHLLIAVNRGLRWCVENGTAEGSDFLEFGIFRGFTFWYTQALARDMGIRDMRFFGFDSFFGLPPLAETDKNGEFKEGAYYSTRQDTEKFLTQYGVDWAKTFLVEGWFEKTLTPATAKKHGLRKCALCVIDCDLYESAREALAFVEPFLRSRSVVLFDDWGNFNNDPDKGEQRAFSEFLKKNTHIKAEPFVEFGGHGKGFVLDIQDR
ncbi:MAG: hypothetical protein A2Z72_06740 [Omnitrophica bacterium RBG_13_46_9]|nr:MAG: hypothetical protein A2Z72_06740 [Omnitrophica bacterium RBG_13_46_9]